MLSNFLNNWHIKFVKREGRKTGQPDSQKERQKNILTVRRTDIPTERQIDRKKD